MRPYDPDLKKIISSNDFDLQKSGRDCASCGRYIPGSSCFCAGWTPKLKPGDILKPAKEGYDKK